MNVYGEPMPSRRPLTSTRVRFGPRPRRSAVATPPAVVRPGVRLPRSWPRSLVKFCGSWLMMSTMSFLPETTMSWLVTTWTGLGLVAFGLAMREPVTITSSWTASFGGLGGCCAIAGAQADATAALRRVERIVRTGGVRTMATPLLNRLALLRFPRALAPDAFHRR